CGSTSASAASAPGLPGQPYCCRTIPVQDCGGELPERRRDTAWCGSDSAEVQHAKPAAREQQKVAGVQVGVHPAGARCGSVDGMPEQPGGQVGRIAAVELTPALGKQIPAPGKFVHKPGQVEPGRPG